MLTKKFKSLKRLRSARVLLPLATCSVVLVFFSATVYALAIPGALADDSRQGNSTVFSSLFSPVNTNSSDPASSENQDGSDLEGGLAASGSFAPAALSPTPSLGAAVLNTVGSTVNGTISQSGGEIHIVDTGNSSGSSENQNKTQDQNNDQSSSGQIAAQAPTFDDETEAAFHAHAVKYYSELSSYYEQLRAGYNNLYAGWAAGKGESARCGVDPQNILTTCDKKRAQAMECVCNGKRIDYDSKWYDEYSKVWRLWEMLVNSASLLREFNEGHTQDYAAERLAVYKSSTGYDSPMDEFAQNYPKVKL